MSYGRPVEGDDAHHPRIKRPIRHGRSRPIVIMLIQLRRGDLHLRYPHDLLGRERLKLYMFAASQFGRAGAGPGRRGVEG